MNNQEHQKNIVDDYLTNSNLTDYLLRDHLYQKSDRGLNYIKLLGPNVNTLIFLLCL